MRTNSTNSTNSTNLHVIPVFILFFVVHLWYFIIEIDVKQKVILFVLVFLFSGLNQWVHDETANSPSVAFPQVRVLLPLLLWDRERLNYISGHSMSLTECIFRVTLECRGFKGVQKLTESIKELIHECYSYLITH